MARLYLLSNHRWVHYSKRGTTAVFRGYPAIGDEPRYSLPDPVHDTLLAELETGARKVGVTEALALLRARGHQGDLTVDWHHTLLLLEQSRWTPPGVPPIPWTPLKDLYLSLREGNRLAGHLAHAKNILAALAEAPDLQRLFEQSAAQIEPYENLRDPLWPPKRPWAHAPEGKLTASRLATLLDPRGWTPVRVRWTPPHADLAFTPVGREVGPLRTRQALRADGTTGRFAGAGGMDLLLRSDDAERLPIVAEVKAEGDANVFFALVQALRYAVELTSSYQFRRLKLLHKPAFDDLNTDRSPRCDVYLISLGSERHRLYREAIEIADRLLARADQPIPRKLRRIAFIQAQLDGDVLRFEATHVAATPEAR